MGKALMRTCWACAVLLAEFAAIGASTETADAPSKHVRRCALFEGIAPPDRLTESFSQMIRAELDRRHWPFDLLTAKSLIAGEGLVGERRYDVLVIPGCEFFPARGMAPLVEYLRSGGGMLLIGGRPFSDLAIRHKDSWLTKNEIEKRRNEIRPERVIVSFLDGELAKWRRATGSPENPTRFSTEPSGHEGVGRALRVDVADFKSWDTLARDIDQPPLDDADALTCFWARGSENLPQLSIEWQEKDGSRWIAVVPVSTEWRHYALPPERFVYWHDNPSKGRGGGGDRLDPGNVKCLAVGVAQSHTNQVARGDHRFWIADIGWARDPFPQIDAEPPHFEILSPWYKTYITDQAKSLEPTIEHGWIGKGNWVAPKEIISPVARSTGAGFVPSRAYRWIPLISATDGEGNERGTAASAFVWRAGEFERSAWGYIGISDEAYLRAHVATIGDWIIGTAAFLDRGAFLGQGGAEHCCYRVGEPWSSKFEILNRSVATVDATVDISIGPRSPSRGQPSKSPMTNEHGVWLEAGEVVVIDATEPSDRPAGLYDVKVVLRNEQWGEIDRIEQVVRVVERNRQPEPRRLVRVRDGNFEVNGQPWVPFGVNFWPLSVTGLEPREYWVHWLSPRFYDPVRTQRDLEQLRAHGMNVVCVQFNNESMARAMMDLLERCRALDLRAFVYLPGGHPLSSDIELSQRLIRAGRLAESDAVFAYDIAWEPRVGDQQRRRQFDPIWREWIAERYGSIESAESDWRVRAPRDEDGRVTGPSREQILNDGPHRVMVAAYRRFLDDAISQGYGRVVRAIRDVDPHHLIGVRSGYGGNGNPWADAQMPFDLASGAKHLDFISPEGYGHGPSWETVRTAGLTTLYARMVSGGKPVWWAEYGMSVHPQPNEQALVSQGEMYANFARMFVESGANGGAGWWFPGGYRVEERSDYGVFNPDGTPRPAALANRKWSERVAAIRGPKGPTDVVIKVDRDLHPRGYSQIRARHEKEYVAAVEAGKSVALATEATGTHSGNCSLVAVGNRPYNGHNPPKYLNAEFERFWVSVGDDLWREVKNGETVKVPRGSRVIGRAQVANTGQAAWLTPKDRRATLGGGGVHLVSVRGCELTIRAPIPKETAFLGDCLVDDLEIARSLEKSASVELEFEAAGRARFGQHFRLALVAN